MPEEEKVTRNVVISYTTNIKIDIMKQNTLVHGDYGFNKNGFHRFLTVIPIWMQTTIHFCFAKMIEANWQSHSFKLLD